MHHYFCLSAIFSHKDFVNFCSYFYSVQCYADVDNNDFLLLKLVTQYHLLISWWWRIHGCLWVSMSVYAYFTDDFFFFRFMHFWMQFGNCLASMQTKNYTKKTNTIQVCLLTMHLTDFQGFFIGYNFHFNDFGAQNICSFSLGLSNNLNGFECDFQVTLWNISQSNLSWRKRWDF